MNKLNRYSATCKDTTNGSTLNLMILAHTIEEAENSSRALIAPYIINGHPQFELISVVEIINQIEEKPRGVIRYIDDLGRIVIPKEVRRCIGVKEGDAMDVTFVGRTVMLNPVCDDPLGQVELAISRLTDCSVLKQNLHKMIVEYKRKEGSGK